MEEGAVFRFPIRQTSGQDHRGFTAARVPADAYLPIIWTFITVSFCFLPLRLYARWKASRRLYSDDAFTVVAWLLALALGAIATYTKDAMYWLQAYESGLKSATDPTPHNASLQTIVTQFARGSIASFFILYICLWCVKIGFLLFFYRLGTRSLQYLRYHWWAVFVFTILCFLGCIPSLPWHCDTGDWETMTSPYCADEQNLSFISMKVNCALDVATDLIIMTIPLSILWRSQIQLRQKLLLCGLFSLVIVTIVVSIIRATVTTIGVKKQLDITWVLLWTTIEANIAIIVACVGSFRTLFIHHRNGSRPSRNSFRMMGTPEERSSRKSKAPKGPKPDTAGWTQSDEPYMAPWASHRDESPRPILEESNELAKLDKTHTRAEEV